jgi:hypothetical protein
VARKVEWNGEWIATRIDSPDGDYLVPPIIYDADGNLLMGAEVLEAIDETGSQVDHAVIFGCTPARLAEIDQQLAQISVTLGLPVRSQ